MTISVPVALYHLSVNPICLSPACPKRTLLLLYFRVLFRYCRKNSFAKVLASLSFGYKSMSLSLTL